MTKKKAIRTFPTGATRGSLEHKLEYAGFLSPKVLERFARYMHVHRLQADGTLRAADNWKKGIDKASYYDSAWRHFVEWGLQEEGGRKAPVADTLCALLFNVMGRLYEELR